MTQAISPSVLLMVIGLILLGCGVLLFFRQRARIAHAIQTEGVVVELIRRRAQGEYLLVKTEQGTKIEKKYLHRPVVRFKTQSGRTVKFSPSIAMRPAPYEVGERVTVLYPADNPQQTQINRFAYLWFYVIMLVLFGFLTLGMGVVIWILQ